MTDTRLAPALLDGTDPVVASPRRRRLRTRVPGTLVLAAVAGLAATIIYVVEASGSSPSLVAVADRDIPAGEPLAVADLRFVELNGADAVVGILLGPGDVENLEGAVATRSIPTGGLVSRHDLSPEASAERHRAMSIPVDAEHAVGGALRPGDRVDVIDGGASPSPVYVLADAEVLAVANPSTSGLGGTRQYSLTVSVDAESAVRVAAAIVRGKIEIVRSTGALPLPPATGSVAPRP